MLGPPSPKLGHGDAIDYMTSSESVHLFLSSDGTVQAYTLPLNRRIIFNFGVDIVVDGIFSDERLRVEFGLILLKDYVLNREMSLDFRT